MKINKKESWKVDKCYKQLVEWNTEMTSQNRKSCSNRNSWQNEKLNEDSISFSSDWQNKLNLITQSVGEDLWKQAVIQSLV